MKIENTQVYGFQAALRGMRNPMDSWDKSDSYPYPEIAAVRFPEGYGLGESDLKLCKKLIKGGSEHRKFLRQIIIWVDFTIARRIWQEMDTYKVATVRNSCSTMHKLGHTELTEDDFETGVVLSQTLQELNGAGWAYRKKVHFRANNGKMHRGYDIVDYMKKILPEGFLQKATYTMSYETAMNMYKQRKKHRLPEWTTICDWIKSLPYMEEFLDG